jgi:hypothetical protein
MGVGTRKSMWRAVYHRVFGWVKVHRTQVNDLRRRQITVETHTMTIIRPSHSRRWCRKCAREVEVAPIGEAGQLIGMTQLVLKECAETERWHLLEDVDGSIQVCLDSLLRSG